MNQNTDYETYKQWKKWGPERKLQPWQERYFSLEIARARLPRFQSVLEIGFGNGEFLQWAKRMGADPVGLEIIPELVEAASGSGHKVYHLNLVKDSMETSPLKDKTFDCIVAFDVIEHLTIEQAQEAFRRMSRLLNPGGKVILRFPNGESFLYVPTQNGDHTHRMDVCQVKLKHLCIGSGLDLEGYYNAARVANKRTTAWLKWVIFRMRDSIETIVGYLYYNKRRPLDPVATAILRKSNLDAD